MAAKGSPRRPEGISVRHSRHCPSARGGACGCRPSYQAQVFSSADRKTIRKTFRTLSDARAWRAQAKADLDRGTLRAPTRTTLKEAAEEWLKSAEAGIVRTRSGDRYKPSALRATSKRAHKAPRTARAPAPRGDHKHRRPGRRRPPRRRRA